MRNLYEVLGVERTASLDELRDAYRKLALELHPDRNPGDKAKEERFKEISHAYGVLSDDRQRARHDHELNRPVPRPMPTPQAYEPPPFDPFGRQEKYRATKASFFYQYGERKRRAQGNGGWDPFGQGTSPDQPMVFHTDGNPFDGPASFTVAAPIDMGKPVPLFRANNPMPGQPVPVMPHPQFGQIPVYFQFRKPSG